MPRKKRNAAGTELDLRRKYTDMEKREVALHYIMCGSAKGTAKRAGEHNPRFASLCTGTVGSWLRSDSFKEMVSEAEEEYERRIRGRMNQIIDKSHSVTLKRLDEGNPVIGKDGKIAYVGVSGKDSAVIGGIYYDKRRLSLGLASKITASAGSNQALENLAKQFEAIAEASQMRTIRRNESIQGEYEEITPPEKP